MTLSTSLLIIFCTLLSAGLAFGFVQVVNNQPFIDKLNGFGNFLLFVCGGPIIWIISLVLFISFMWVDAVKQLKLIDKLKQLCFVEEYKPVKTRQVNFNMSRNVKVDTIKKGWFTKK